MIDRVCSDFKFLIALHRNYVMQGLYKCNFEVDFENVYFTALLNVYNICIIGTCYVSLVVSVAADEIIL